MRNVDNAIAQLPVSTARPSLVVMCAQRWPLSGDTHVLETMIGSTTGYGGGRVLLHDDTYGELATHRTSAASLCSTTVAAQTSTTPAAC